MIERWLAASDLMQAGGLVLVVILMLSLLMWYLILERFWFFHYHLSRLVSVTVDRWQTSHSDDDRINRRLRSGLTSGFHAQLSSGLAPIQAIAAALPMLGLLGTVVGMIKTFEVMTVFGSGNVRGMADGISQALITTMAGLITALCGMFFADRIEQRARLETERLGEYLSSTNSEAS